MTVQPLRPAEMFVDVRTGQLTPVAVRFFDSIIKLLDRVIVGAGTPESNVTAPIGTLYLRTDGGASTTLYVKESGTGNTGWIAK